jgi:AraC-like DNA-binding protein
MSRLLNYQYPFSYLLASANSWTKYGLDTETYLRMAGVEIARPNDANATFTGEDIKKLNRIGKRLNKTGQPDSILVAEQLNFTNIGLLGLGIIATQNLREAFALLKDFYPLSIPGLSLDFQTNDDELIINYAFDSEFDDSLPFLNEVLVCVMKRFTDLFETPVDPLLVQFSHQPDYPLAIYEQFLGCPVLVKKDLASALCTISFSQAALDIRLKYPDAATLALIKQQLQAALAAKSSEGSWVGRVEKIWLNRSQSSASNNHCLSQTEMADQLNLSVRTLVRRLAEEGYSYRELTQKWRLDKAKKLLKRSQMPIAHIAAEIGFDDESAFFRFFKEAEGITPKQYRSSVST